MVQGWQVFFLSWTQNVPEHFDHLSPRNKDEEVLDKSGNLPNVFGCCTVFQLAPGTRDLEVQKQGHFDAERGLLAINLPWDMLRLDF